MKLIKPSFKIDLGSSEWTMLSRIEKIGRTCYKSDSKFTSKSSVEFVKRLIGKGHLSVLEHESFSVRFIIDRGVSHELVRHRLCAFSQESTRYCNYSGGVTFIIPPWVDIEPLNLDVIPAGLSKMENCWVSAMFESECQYLWLLDNGWTPQQARSVLPNSLKTEIVVTANIREWIHIFTLRTSKKAHPQMQEVMVPLLVKMKELIPVVFDKIGV